MRYLEYAGYTINLDKVPKHLGVIMDGNGRWATKQGLTRSQGHKEGVKRIEDLLRKQTMSTRDHQSLHQSRFLYKDHSDLYERTSRLEENRRRSNKS